MASSTGINEAAARPLSDWEHVQQSIRKILTTPIGSRPMRRTFGSKLPDLVDAKMIDRNILAIYSATAEAIDRWEPRFRMRQGSVLEADVNGVVNIEIFGTYFPRGHLGDFSVAEDQSVRVAFGGSF